MASSAQPDTTGPAAMPLHGRAWALGLAGSLLLAAFIPYSDLVLAGTWLGLTSFPIGSFCGLLLLLALNAPLRRLGRGLRGGELLAAYAMMMVAAGVASFGLVGLLIPYAAGPAYFATPENHFAETVLRYLPRWLLLPESVGQAMYEGLPPGGSLPWRTWVRPAVGWGLLVAGAYLFLTATIAVVRERWIEAERLVFPLGVLPLEMTRYESDRQAWPGYLRDPIVWGFFAVPFLVHCLNGIHHHLPAVPGVNIHRIDLGALMPGRYGEAVRPLWIRGLFTVVGLTYLLPSDLGLSLWVCYAFFMVQQMVGAHLGAAMPAVQAYPTKRFVALQMIGGILVFGVSLAWQARFAVAKLWRAMRQRREVPGEPLSPAAIGLALVLGLALLLVWSDLVRIGMPLVVLMFVLFGLLQLVATRLVAEAGMLYVQHPYRPLNLMLTAVGSATLGPPKLPALVLLDHLFMLDNRSPLQPILLQGWQFASAAGFSARRLAWAQAATLVLAVPVAAAVYISLMLKHGGTGLNPWFTSYYSNNLFGTWSAHLVMHGELARPVDFGWLLAGALTMLSMLSLHHRWPRWPLHPAGYLMGASWPMVNFWFPVALGWLLKSLTLRFGGARWYRRLLPGFLALILAEYASAGLWVVIDALCGVHGHEIFTF